MAFISRRLRHTNAWDIRLFSAHLLHLLWSQHGHLRHLHWWASGTRPGCENKHPRCTTLTRLPMPTHQAAQAPLQAHHRRHGPWHRLCTQTSGNTRHCQGLEVTWGASLAWRGHPATCIHTASYSVSQSQGTMPAVLDRGRARRITKIIKSRIARGACHPDFQGELWPPHRANTKPGTPNACIMPTCLGTCPAGLHFLV